MAMKWKMPPKAKVYEALSAFVDGRVTLLDACEAAVTSSSGDKTYTVRWSDDATRIVANDNASFYQGYIGYPIIAVLIRFGKLDADLGLAEKLKGISWKKLNDRFKRDYDKAVEYVLAEAGVVGEDRDKLVAMVDRLYVQLDSLGLTRLPGVVGRPPAANR
jgi:hypothetical protein